MDVLDLFEDSLESLFGYHQTARGDAGQLIDFEHRDLPDWLPLASSSSSGGASTCSFSQDVRPLRRLPYRIPTTSQAANNRLFAHHQWDAGSHLAKLIVEASTDAQVEAGGRVRSPFDVRGKDVLELGAGTGLPSLVAAACTSTFTSASASATTSSAAEDTAHSILITDYPDPSIVRCLEENIAGLRQLAEGAGEGRGQGAMSPGAARFEMVRAMGLEWGDEGQTDEALRFSTSSAGYNLLLLADCLWLSSSHAVLLHTLRRLLRRDRDARAVVVAGFHSGRAAVGRFFRRAAGRREEGETEGLGEGEGENENEMEGQEVKESEIKGRKQRQMEGGRDAPLIPDANAEHGGIWQVHTSGRVRRGLAGFSLPALVGGGEGVAGAKPEGEGEDKGEEGDEEADDSDDIHDRARWMVVAVLRWGDLVSADSTSTSFSSSSSSSHT